MRSWTPWTKKRIVKQLTIIETEKGYSLHAYLLEEIESKQGRLIVWRVVRSLPDVTPR